MHTPSPTYVCPRCRAPFDAPTNYCGRCGADMRLPDPGEHAVHPDDEARDSDEWQSSDEWPSRRDRRAEGRDRWLGRIVDGRYRVIEVIGRGGMGVVYKVEHQRMGKIAAMKVLHGELATDPEVTGRFRREAEAVSRLNHPNTVQVFDFGTTDGALYLIMEYVRGLDLGTLVKRDGPIPFDRAASLLGQICAALLEAHDLGIVHRDLKPENVLVTRTHGGRDFIKVLDFGLAKLSERPDAAEVTDRGSIVGTPYFMSPEQIRGEDVDQRSDIYSLGALMYRVITGRHPYTAKSPVGVLTKHLTAELVPPSERRPDLDIDPRVDDIVLIAMARRPDDRYASAAEMLGDIEEVHGAIADGASPVRLSSFSAQRRSSSQAGAGLLADAVDYGIDSAARLRRSDLDRYERSLRRRRVLLGWGVPLALAGAAAGLVYLLVVRPAQPRLQEAEPNDELAAATLIEAGAQVHGYLGKRISKTEPDRDWYRVAQRPDPAGTDAVSAHLTGLPNMDVTLSLYDGSGRLLGHSDEGGIGHDEWIHRLQARGELFVLVSQDGPGGPRLPIENVSDRYTVSITIEPAGDDVEREPNDSPADAVAIAPGAPRGGHLDRRADIDVYRFGGQAGRYLVAITGADQVPLSWRVDDAEPTAQRQATVELRAGAIITLRRTDRELDEGSGLPGAHEPYQLSITPAP